MGVTIVVGGQFGSEGKGKVASLLAQSQSVRAVVRVGGPNSGHTPPLPDFPALRQLPTAAYNSEAICVLPAGSYIQPEVLENEILATGLTPDRLLIDRNASILTFEDQIMESNGELLSSIGSTGSGTGRSVVRRIERDVKTLLAKDLPELGKYLGDAPHFLRSLLNKRERVIIEGTQGFGLSLLHGGEYPFATSRETSAAGALAETGLSPIDVDDVVLVLRAHPIRVAGNSGTLPNEITWDDVAASGEHDHAIVEFTTVTKRVRRVGTFHPDVVRRALMVNKPTTIALNHLDYIDHSACSTGDPTPRIADFVSSVESAIEHRVDFWGLDPNSVKLASGERLKIDPVDDLALSSAE